MAKTKTKKTFIGQVNKPLLATALAVAGVFNLALSVVAAGTTAGTPINNTATATYEDGNGTTINSTSNTVTINVAEIAGLIATPTGILDVNSPGAGGAVEANDQLVFSFEVTNTGNDETDVFIPGTDNIITQNLATVTQVELFTADGLTSLGVVPAAGGNYATINAGGANGGINLPADGSFVVRVTGTASPTSGANNPVGVTLGNTPPNDNSPATQNEAFNDEGATNDLRTVNVPASPVPTNGDREASATQSIPFGANVNPLALATVLKTSSVVNNDAASPTDDQITYSLDLRVEGTVPGTNTFQAASLEGTNMRLDGADVERILVSDAIPVGTVLESVGAAPTGWTPVYSIVAAAGVDPLSAAADWRTTAPTDLTTVTRVGFVNTGVVAAGGTETGFNFTVLTTGLNPTTGGVVDNIAQAFGQTVGDPTNEVVYDESGDQNPNNFNDDGTPPDATGTNYPAAGDDGVANPGADGVDAGNDNSGTGPDGEVNQVTIVPANDDILNGPSGFPGAVGPNDDNDDFTNLSTAVPAGIQTGTTFDPGAVTFTNTVSNPATGGFLSNVTVEPISPTEAETADGNATTGQYGTNTDIPDGTTVTITFGGQSATYTYNAGAFTTPDAPVNLGNINGGATPVDYTVQVDLPTGETLDDVSIPIIAFPDNNPTNPAERGFNGEVINNITVDRVYTGFMRLLKEARVLDATGTERIPFSNTFNPLTQTISPGEFIEYRVTYENISTPNVGTNNSALTATNFVLTEDGTGPGAGPDSTNNWAAVTTHQQNTVATTGTVAYTDVTGPTTVNADPVNGTKVDIYVNTVGNILPDGNGNVDGSLTFRRIVN